MSRRQNAELMASNVQPVVRIESAPLVGATASGGTKDSISGENEDEYVIAIERKLEELSAAPSPLPIQPEQKFRIFRVSQNVKSKQKLDFHPELVFMGLFNKRYCVALMRTQRQDLQVRSQFLYEEDFKGIAKKCLLSLVQFPSIFNLAIGKWLLRKSVSKQHHKREIIALRSLSKLRDAGINTRGDARGTVDLVPQFKPGILKATLVISTFSTVHRTEILWKNVVAYQSETVRHNDHGKHDQFIYFLKFMDELIDTDEDVFILRRGRRPVIPKNTLGTDKDVAQLFNSITQHYSVQNGPHVARWVSLRREIDAFVNQRTRIIMLEFLRYNFGKPWFVISVLAATVLLILSLLQTLYTVLPYYVPH